MTQTFLTKLIQDEMRANFGKDIWREIKVTKLSEGGYKVEYPERVLKRLDKTEITWPKSVRLDPKAASEEYLFLQEDIVSEERVKLLACTDLLDRLHSHSEEQQDVQ
jgi:hypothetical protein